MTRQALQPNPLTQLAAAVAIALLPFSTPAPATAQSARARVDYQSQVHPILAANCTVCHNAEKRSGGLALATYEGVLAGGRSGAVIQSGQSASSLLMKRLRGEIEPRMPMGGVLNDAQLALLRSWIDQGARRAPMAAPARAPREPKLSLEQPRVPEGIWEAWTRPDDRIVAKYLSEHGTARPALVPDADYARRVYLDAWGLLPTPTELKAFLRDDSVSKRRELVDKLLGNDRHYAEHWISYWNDLLRNDEGVNYYSQNASRQSISSWLLFALESNMSYDQMVRKLLNPQRNGDPVGFLTGVNWRGAVSAGQTQAMQAAQNTAQIFMGVNLKCNSCHDSFISRWTLKDAYGLAAYFSDEERLRLYRCDVPQDEYVKAAFLYKELDRPLPGGNPQERRSVAADIFTDPRNGRLARTLVNRVYAKLLGRGIVEDSDDMDSEPWSPALLDWLASDFVSSGYDPRHLIRTIITSNAYQLPAVTGSDTQPAKFVFRGPELRRLSAEQFTDAVASITGDWRVVQTAVRAENPAMLPQNEEIQLSVAGSPEDGSSRAPDSNSRPRNSRPRTEPDDSIQEGFYTREWRTAGNNLTRALGRPIRDQIFSSRETRPTTIQMLELTNGELLTYRLHAVPPPARGTRRVAKQPGRLHCNTNPPRDSRKRPGTRRRSRTSRAWARSRGKEGSRSLTAASSATSALAAWTGRAGLSWNSPRRARPPKPAAGPS